jgi:hypothetical protein
MYKMADTPRVLQVQPPLAKHAVPFAAGWERALLRGRDLFSVGLWFTMMGIAAAWLMVAVATWLAMVGLMVYEIAID